MADGEARHWLKLRAEKLDPQNPPDATGFRPVRGEFTTFWKKGRIAREFAAHVGSCWFARKDDDRLAGYITLLADCLRVQRRLLESEDVRYSTFPAVKIGLLAVDERAKGLGTALMHWAFRYVTTEICPRLAVRFVTVDALYDPDSDYDTSGFYERFGFTFADGEGKLVEGEPFRTMYFDLKPILDALSANTGSV